MKRIVIRLVGISLVGVLAGCSSSTTTTTSKLSAAALSPPSSVSASRITQIVGLKNPYWVTAGDGSIWVTEYQWGNLVRIDPGHNRISARRHVGVRAAQFVLAGGAAWVVDDYARKIRRVDTTSLAVSDVSVATPEWVPAGIAFGEGSVWISLLWGNLGPNGTQMQVVRVDPKTATVSTRIPFSGESAALAVGGGAVWVASLRFGDPSGVFRIDPQSGRIVARVDTGHEVSGALAFGNQAVWVANTDGYLSRIDPSNNQVSSYQVGSPEWPAILATSGAVWLSAPLGGLVARFDPTTGEIGTTIATGRRPQGLTLAGGALWVANYEDGTVSRIPVP